MIDRDKPEDSLLLQYLLPAKQARRRHPAPPQIRSVVKSVTDLKYRRIHQWLTSLSALRPHYDVSWRPPGTPAPAPGPAPPK